MLRKENEIKTKDIQLSNLPDYFGVDRALACIAALKIIENPFKKDLLIADFGTILSITKLNSNGSIIGGQLLPGFLTQLKSMEQNTKNLKVPKKYDIFCWASGVRSSQTENRNKMKFIEVIRQRLSLRPLLSWTNKDIFYYMEENNLPAHPLFIKGYSSVGDWHSSSPDGIETKGRDTRFGGIKQECGIHTNN